MPLVFTPFRFPQFRVWIGATSISVIGTWMQVLAANWLLLSATGSAAKVGLGMLAQALPTVVFGPWAGILADRLPPKPVLTVSQLAQGAIWAALGFFLMSGGQVVALLFAALLLSGVVAAFENPVMGRFSSQMVDRAHLGPSLAANSLSNAVGRVIGMGAGGAVVATVGPAPLFLLNAVTFLVVVAALLPLRPLPAEAVDPAADGARGRDTARPDARTGEAADAPKAPRSAWAGLFFVLRDPMVLTTLGLAFLLGNLGRSVQVTMAAMSEGPLHAGAEGYGQLSTVFAIGTIIGGLLAGRAGRFRPQHLVLVGVVMSVLQAASGASPGLWWFAAVLLPMAAAAVLVDTVVATRLQLSKPLSLRGRVLAAVAVTGAISGATGSSVLGWLSDVVGPRGALILAGVLAVVGSVVVGLLYARLRRRREDRAEAVRQPATEAPAPAGRTATRAALPRQRVALAASPTAARPAARRPEGACRGRIRSAGADPAHRWWRPGARAGAGAGRRPGGQSPGGRPRQSRHRAGRRVAAGSGRHRSGRGGGAGG